MGFHVSLGECRTLWLSCDGCRVLILGIGVTKIPLLIMVENDYPS